MLGHNQISVLINKTEMDFHDKFEVLILAETNYMEQSCTNDKQKEFNFKNKLKDWTVPDD